MTSSPPLDPPTFPFDLSNSVVCDVETYPGHWCVGFQGTGRDGDQTTLVIDNDRDKLDRTLQTLADHGKTLITYNGDHFDVPVIRAILRGLDPYAIGGLIIRGERLPVPLSRLPELGVDHIDLSARLRRGGGFPGLKRVAAYLGRPRLQELPYRPGTILTDAQWAEVKTYNELDLAHTRALLERFSPELQALAALSDEQQQDLRSTPTPRVVEHVFLNAYKRQRGVEPTLPEPPREILYRGVAGIVRPRTPEAAAWHDLIINRPLPMVGQGDRLRPEVPRAQFAIGSLKVTVGSGGLHSADVARVHYETRKHRLVSVDVSSYYPSLIATKGISPRSYGDIGAATYKGILERRLEVKRLAKTAEDPAERKRLEIQATALKLILNSTFGKLGDPYSSLFDPAAFLAVTLSGQLMLIDLIERLTAVGVRVISANTDGLFVKVRRTNRRWKKVLKAWEADTAMSLEVDPLKRLAILASNRFAVLDRSDKIKRKGAGVKGDLSPTTSPNNLVVADAVVAALLQDVPPERTIRSCTDPVRFCSVTQRSGKVTAAVLVDDDGTETELPKVARWYKAYQSSRRIEHRFEGDRHTTPSNATGINLALDLVDGELPRDVDFSWYISQARKSIQSVPGYRHLSRRRLGDHQLALEAHARGLAPVPKWKGKAQTKGADRSLPTYLWDWHGYATIGTYTGPSVGILVLDIDEFLRWKAWVDRGNSPLLQDRWSELAGCLVSCRGDATPEQVRTGRGRGKLIFRFAVDADHPLARIKIGQWKKNRGVEIFFGQGTPTVLGAHPDGTTYRLDGTLGAPPDFLIEGLIPARRSRVVPHGPGPGSGSGPRRNRQPIEGESEGEGEGEGESEADPDVLEGLPAALAALATELGRRAVGWRTKDLGDGRSIWVGKCPYEHDSGTGSDSDLYAGYNQEGAPYICCRHASCTKIPEINRRLRESVPSATARRVEPPEFVPEAIATAMVRDLDDRLVSVHLAPTGAGKTKSMSQAAALRYREGLATLIAVPTLRLAGEVERWLGLFAADAVAADAVAKVCGQDRPIGAAATDSDELRAQDNDDQDSGTYPIHEWTRIVICTHPQLGRRGYSRFIRGIWPRLAATDDHGGRPSYAIIIDELGVLCDSLAMDFPLSHRVTYRNNPDRSGGWLLPLQECPKSNFSGNCGNCTCRNGGGELRFNHYHIRELFSPRAIEVGRDGGDRRAPGNPLVLDLCDFRYGPPTRYESTIFRVPVLSYRGRPLGPEVRRTAAMWPFQKGEDGGQEFEAPADLVASMLDFAFNPTMLWEQAVDQDGKPVDAEVLQARIDRNDRSWDAGIVFPQGTCANPRLRFADQMLFEQVRRFAERERVGVVFTGIGLSGHNEAVVKAVFPKAVVRQHGYPDRKVSQAAVVFVEGKHAPDVLIGDDDRLVTAPLEATDRTGIVFARKRKVARLIYDRIKRSHPTVRFGEENDLVLSLSGSLHDPDTPLQCYLTYGRGVLGGGANVLGLRYVVVDAHGYRPRRSFNPIGDGPDAFSRACAREFSERVEQNIGRAFRGEDGKTVVVFILGAKPELQAEIRSWPILTLGADRPPVFSAGEDLRQLIDQGRRWLDAGGGNWPDPDPVKATVARPKGKAGRKPRKTAADVLAAAEAALGAGVEWKEFWIKHNPQRQLDKAQIAALKARFEEKSDSLKQFGDEGR